MTMMRGNDGPDGSETERYIEDVGTVLADYGLPRMWGRVFGALLVADPPEQSAEQLAEKLRASRGSISTATRMLEQTQLIERVNRPGDRKDYFRNRPGAWREISHSRMVVFRRLRELAERGLAIVDSDDSEVRRGLADMHAYMTFLEREYPKLIERWESGDDGEPQDSD